ncbi:MAG: glycosyltransferase family 4 protein [Lachnospiraceae bacterium]|nr:glycosyltransferase family 4 protein [Lachnospiraceae bacterium]
MRKILIITGRYVPGFRDGGPVRSILNLTEWLGNEYDIRIMCLDRDHGDTAPYPDIKTDEYNEVGNARVWYTPKFSEDAILKLSADADVVYCCGPYSDYARMAMKLKKQDKIKAPLYIASMGSFSPEAFRIKGGKKRLFISYMKMMGYFNKIIWSVTSEREEDELKAVVGNGSRCVIAADLPRRNTAEHDHTKSVNELKLIFLSRICRKKNLEAVADILRLLEGDIRIKLDIYGTKEDPEYLRKCMASLDELKKTHPLIKWEYIGEADSDSVPEIFAGYDAFVFPTLGENYGHVIAESIAVGCIPVISDTTPWLDLDEKECGYVCSLDDLQTFADRLAELAAMDEEQLAYKREKCREYTGLVNDRSVRESGYHRIFG